MGPYGAAVGCQGNRACVDSGPMPTVGSQLHGRAVADNLEVGGSADAPPKPDGVNCTVQGDQAGAQNKQAFTPLHGIAAPKHAGQK